MNCIVQLYKKEMLTLIQMVVFVFFCVAMASHPTSLLGIPPFQTESYALVIGNPTTPTPEKHGAYVGVIGDWTFLCTPWGGGLGQFRQWVHCRFTDVKYWQGSTKCTRDSKWLTSKVQRSKVRKLIKSCFIHAIYYWYIPGICPNILTVYSMYKKFCLLLYAVWKEVWVSFYIIK